MSLEQKRTALATSESVLPVSEPLQVDSAAAVPTRAEEMQERRRQKRLARYNEVIALSRAFKNFLNRRWAEGCHNATQLWQEIQAEGYAGGRSRSLASWPPFARMRTGERFTLVSTKPNFLLQGKPPCCWPARKTQNEEQQLLAQLTAACPEVSTLHALTQGFANVFRSKQSEALQSWLAEAKASGLPEINWFGDGLLRDVSAVTAAVILPWSNGRALRARQSEPPIYRIWSLSLEEYKTGGAAHLPEETRKRISEETGPDRIDFECDLILVCFDSKDEVRLFTMDSLGRIRESTATGFAVIGSGSVLTTAELYSLGFDGLIQLPEALYCVYEAKKKTKLKSGSVQKHT